MNMYRAQLQSQLLAQRNQHIQQADGICSPGKSDYDIFIFRDHMIPLHIEKNFFRQIHPAASFFPLCAGSAWVSFVLIDSSARAGALFALSLGARGNQLVSFVLIDSSARADALLALSLGARGNQLVSFVPLHYTSDVCSVKLLILHPLSPVLRFSRFP